MKEEYENEMAVPSEEKLESLSNLFDFALLPKEKRLYILFILLRGLQLMGRTDLLKMIAQIETNTVCQCECMDSDTVSDCDCKCPVCNSDRDDDWNQKTGEILFQKMKHFAEDCDCDICRQSKGILFRDGNDDEWAEVIH